ncbi:unnamed protein product, partial [Rotaria sp. Silwood1]
MVLCGLLIDNDYYVGEIEDDESVLKPTNILKCSHGGVIDKTGNISAVGCSNKDESIKKLDRLARDITFTQSINLVTILSNEHDNSRNNSIFDRFCFLILPRIQHDIQCLTLDSLSIDRALRIGNYSKLHKLSLINLPIEMACRIFNGIDLLYSPKAFIDLPSRTCYSSNIIYLNVRLNDFNDCLCLLNGYLSQLHTFIVEIAFPLLNKLTVFNRNAQKKKLTHQQGEYEQTSSVIEFPHLTILNLGGSSLDYVEQFLFDFYTCLPCLNTLYTHG